MAFFLNFAIEKINRRFLNGLLINIGHFLNKTAI